MTSSKKSSNFVIILILGALATVSPFSIDMYLPGFSLIADDFGTTAARISLSVSSYFVGLALGQLLYGPLLDRYGRKIPLYAGLALYMVACIGCMQSTTIEQLVVFRFIQAIGGCVASVAAMTMVRDFFPVEESAKVFSLLILILGVSPLLAPTFGGFITTFPGWRWIFIILAVIVFLILMSAVLWLPPGQAPDKSISLKAKPMLSTFYRIVIIPQFSIYALSSSFSFASLFIYVSGSPVIFMERFKVSPEVYGGIFALLSLGFIGSNQANILMLKYFKSHQIFRIAMAAQVLTVLVFLLAAWNDWLGMTSTIVMFFISLSCLGFIYPNGTALALAPFTRNVGSASALIGSLQIGVAALASACIGLFNSSDAIPVTAVMVGTSLIGWIILIVGQKKLKIAVKARDAGVVGH